MLFPKQIKSIFPDATMEFDEINALINIEREKYQHDLMNGTIYAVSRNIKQTKQQIRAERAAMDRVKQCTRQVQVAMARLNVAMVAHAQQLKTAY